MLLSYMEKELTMTETQTTTTYDPKHVYRAGENVPAHGARQARKKNAKKKRRDNGILPQRGAAVAGTGKPKGASGGKG